MEKNTKKIEKIIALCKRKGFIYPGSEIYGGFANSYTYGPYGVELKNNIKKFWWKFFVHEIPEMRGIDGDIILHPKAWQSSGHTENFNDALTDCKNCKARLRVDHLLEEQLSIDCEGKSVEELSKLLKENKIKCPSCGKNEFTPARHFNLMFQTQMAKTGTDSVAYLRPETAQAIFLEFKNIVDTSRVKLPFGIAQIGKAFRNEITPGNFIFRRLEFEQMEIEYFVEEKDWEKIFADWQASLKEWCKKIGLKSENLREYEHAKEKLSHYSKKTVDIEFNYPFAGFKELYGLAYRTNFDLAQHEKFSGKELKIFNEETKEKVLPHVIEPSFGVDRTMLAILCDAYTEEKLEDGTERIVLKFVPHLAPVKIAILPLMKKDGMSEKAKEIQNKVKHFGYCEYDETGSIGKRYRRQDEIGTPVCITIDYETLETDTVTIRDRDSMQQERVKTSELLNILNEKYFHE